MACVWRALSITGNFSDNTSSKNNTNKKMKQDERENEKGKNDSSRRDVDQFEYVLRPIKFNKQ